MSTSLAAGRRSPRNTETSRSREAPGRGPGVPAMAMPGELCTPSPVGAQAAAPFGNAVGVEPIEAFDVVGDAVFDHQPAMSGLACS